MSVDITDAIDGPYYGDGSTKAFPFTIAAAGADEIAVYAVSAAGTVTISKAAYTVSYSGKNGTVTFANAPANIPGTKLYIVSDPDFTQQIKFGKSSNFLPDSVNDANDRAAIRDLALRYDIARAPKVPIGQSGLEYGAIAEGQVVALVNGRLMGTDNDPALAESAAARAESALADSQVVASEVSDTADQVALDAAQVALDKLATDAAVVEAGNINQAVSDALAVGTISDLVGTRIYASKDLLDADLVPEDDEYALVVGDTTAANNDLYQKNGATTTGSWDGPLGIFASASAEAYLAAQAAEAAAETILATMPKYYENEWDKDAVVLGNLGATGNVAPSSSIYVSDFIETKAGASYTASVGDIGVQVAISKAVFYDADKVFIPGGYSEHNLPSGQSYTVVAPAGAAYRRYTVSQSAREVFLVTYGTEVISPDDIGKYYDLGFLGYTDAPALPEQSITGEYIAPKAVSLSSLADDVRPTVYKNEWDKDAVVLGNFSLTTGNVVNSEANYVTNLIPVEAGQVFSFYQGDIEGGIGNNVRVGFYTTEEVWIGGTDTGIASQPGRTFTKTAPADGFMRVGSGQGGRNTLLVNIGGTPITEDQIGEVANFGMFDDIEKPLLRPKSVTARYIADGAIGEDQLDPDLLDMINGGGGGGSVPRKYPNPPTIPFVEVGASNDVAYWLSEDGEVLYLRNFFQLKQSMDDLATPAVNIGAPFAKQIRGVRLLPDGQLLVSTSRDNSDSTRAQVWKSDNYNRNSPAGTTFSLVHTAIGDYADFYNHWGMDCYQNIVLLCEYGTKESLGARRVYLSQDTGETFSLIFYQEDIFSDLGIPYNAGSAHTHTVAYDPWFNRIWVVTGDGINTGTFYSDDLGSTWQVVAGSTGLSAVQYTGIIALADCVVFGSDRAPNGLHIFKRSLSPADPVTIKPWSIIDNFSITSKIFQMPFRRALGEPVYFGSFHDNRVGDGHAVVMSFVDKYSVALAYELPFLYTEAIGNLGMQHVIGATAQGNIFTQYYNGTQSITLKAPAPVWS